MRNSTVTATPETSKRVTAIQERLSRLVGPIEEETGVGTDLGGKRAVAVRARFDGFFG